MTMFRLIRSAALVDNQATNDLGDGVLQTGAAGLLVQSYCTQVIQQPAIVIPAALAAKLPPIGTFLKTAQDNASDYLNNLQPRIIAVITDVGGYASQFNAFVGLINGKIGDWKGGSTQAKLDALALLQQLQIAVSARKENVTSVATAITTYKTKVDGDAGNFNTASAQADVVIGGDQGAIASLQSSIDDLDKQIGGAAAGVALSGLAILGGVFIVAVGAIADFVTAGVSTPIVVGGVALIVAGAAGLTASSIVLAKLIDTKANLISEKSQLDADLKFLHTFKSTTTQLSSAAQTASQQLTNMSNAWNILGGNLGNVVGSLQSARTYSDLPIVVQAYLNTAGSQWATVQGNVQTIEAQMAGVKTSVLKNANGSLGALNSASLQKLAA